MAIADYYNNLASFQQQTANNLYPRYVTTTGGTHTTVSMLYDYGLEAGRAKAKPEGSGLRPMRGENVAWLEGRVNGMRTKLC